MDELTAFIGDRLDEDEQVARAGLEYDGKVDHRYRAGPGGELLGGISLGTYHHHYRPKRALAEVAANRAILAAHPHTADTLYSCWICGFDAIEGRRPGFHWHWCATVRQLGTIWGDHPGYRQEWRPSP